MNSVIELLRSHRSIRSFEDKKIPEGLLKDILSSGQAAATSSLIQATTIIRVTDPKLREALCEVGGGQAYIKDAPEFLVFCADLNRASRCCEMYNETPIKGLTEHFIIATVDVSLVAQNIVIASESSGLGICYIGALRNDPAKVCEILKLPDNVYPVFGLCIGFPAQNPEVKPRLPLEVIVKENYYDTMPEEKLIKKYDNELNSYYESRSMNNKVSVWSEQMSGKLSKESRTHMKDFLNKRGFIIR
jgi:nitroreductase